MTSSTNTRLSIILASRVLIKVSDLIRLEAAIEIMNYYKTVNYKPTVY